MFFVKPANNLDGSHPQKYKGKLSQSLYRVMFGDVLKWMKISNFDEIKLCYFVIILVGCYSFQCTYNECFIQRLPIVPRENTVEIN